MNKNYLAGRRFEYERKKSWESTGHIVCRSSGSHGLWDLCAVHKSNPIHPVYLLQLKRLETTAQAQRMLTKFKKNPPLKPSAHYHFVLEMKVKGSSVVISTTI